MISPVDYFTQLLCHDSDHCVAFDKNHRPYSSSQLRADITHCTSRLANNSHQTYLLYADNSYHFVVNFLSLLILQKNVTLTANNKPEWLSSIDDAYDVKIIDNASVSDINSDHFLGSTHSSNNHFPITIPQDLTSTIRFYTSGSSNQPKAISKSLHQLLLEVETLEHTFSQSIEQSVFIASVSHHHIYGLIFRLLWPLFYKRGFYAEILLYPEQLQALTERHGNLCFVSSPAFLSRLDPQLPSIQLQQCFSSGSLLGHNAANKSKEQLGLYPTEVFGSTETGGIGYRTQANENSNWTAFSGISFNTLNSGLTELLSPYIDQSMTLDDKIDLVSQKHFQLLGRIDRVVKIEEKRVSLDAIEKTIKQSEWVDDVKVIVLERKRTILAAVVSLASQEEHSQLSKADLTKQLKNQLQLKFEAVAIPRKWRYLDQLPYNSQGKLPVSALEALF